MLNEQLKTTIQTAYSRILESKGLKPRYGQRLMIADIARTLGNIDKADPEIPHICTLEAGTGTGKTIAYLVSALPIAKEHKKKLIISTATIALQEQILNKDLPDLQKHSGLNFSFTLAKGRKRYVCLYHLKRYVSQDQQAELPLSLESEQDLNNQPLYNNKDDIKLYKTLNLAWEKNQWDGEIDSWDDFIPHSSWSPLTSDQHQCSGKRCSYYNECIYYKARERVFKVDCIVVNHDLVLSDLNMGGGFILPAPDESIYIFDEGHHLPNKAINHFKFSFRTNSTIKWLETINTSLKSFSSSAKPPKAILQIIHQTPEQIKEISEQTKQLLALLSQLQFPENRFSSSGSSIADKYENILRFKFGCVPDELREQCYFLLKSFEKLYNLLQHITSFLKDILDGGEVTDFKTEHAEQWLPVLSPMQNRVETALNLFQDFSSKESSINEKPPLPDLSPKNTGRRNLATDTESDNQPPNARWLSKTDDNEGKDLELSCSPTLAANSLEQILWSQCYGAIVTSATIAALGSFDRFILNSGVPGIFNILPSPFNYQENVEFIVPAMHSDATQYQAHTDEVIELLEKIIDPDKGTLVLFSSKKQMNDVEYALLLSDGGHQPVKNWKRLLLTQGQRNKQVIINDHKKQIDKDKGSVILGLASFAEGIDLPGKYCEHVIIAKLPFSVPNDPVDASLTEWLESQGRNAFMEISVPDASIKLVQACGRLIRKETDQGKITLLDKRIFTKFYGKKILNALPPYQRHINVSINDVSSQQDQTN
ncbi:MAG: ATP-dependent DNA helicase DinG [gamma proteobacterium symbiont of Taylorina sp.]|nr:ATP-dependent DNA helicase DinG [gamma proteobacterium symbiont of Taylorina sp.]